MWTKTIYTFLLLWCAAAGISQDWSWVKQIGGVNNEDCTAISTDGSRNIYFAGNFSGSINIDGQQINSNSSIDVFLAKSDSVGVVDWVITGASTRSDETIDLIVDKEGNVIWTGYFRETFIINQDTVSASFSSKAIFLAKISSEGEVLFLKEISGTGLKEIGETSITSDNDYIIVGNFEDSLFFESESWKSESLGDVFLLKISAEGELIWLEHSGISGSSRGRTCIHGSNGAIYIGGHFEGEINFGTDTIKTNTADTDIFLAKYSKDGTPIWGKKAGGVYPAYCEGLVIDEEDQLFLAGSFPGVLKLNDSLQIQTSGQNTDFFLLSYDTLGNALWAKAYGSNGQEESTDLLLHENQLVVSGTFNSSFNLGNSRLNMGSGTLNGFIAGISKDGDVNWSTAIPSSGFAIPNKLDQLGTTLLNAGVFSSDIQFNNQTTNAQGFFDFYIGALNNELTPVVNQVRDDLQILLYPNPTNSQLFIYCNDKQPRGILLNVLGQSIKSFEGNTLNTASLSPGGYYLIIEINNQKHRRSFLKQ